MDGTFKMSPEQLRDKSRELMNMANRFQELIDHMNRDQNELATSAWVSEASLAYSEEFKNYLPMLQAIKEKMVDFSRFFEQSGNSTDALNRNIINSING